MSLSDLLYGINHSLKTLFLEEKLSRIWMWAKNPKKDTSWGSWRFSESQTMWLKRSIWLPCILSHSWNPPANLKVHGKISPKKPQELNWSHLFVKVCSCINSILRLINSPIKVTCLIDLPTMTLWVSSFNRQWSFQQYDLLWWFKKGIVCSAQVHFQYIEIFGFLFVPFKK